MIDRKVMAVALVFLVLIAGISIYAIYRSKTYTEPSGVAGTNQKTPTVPLGDGTVKTYFVNVSSNLVLTKNENILVTTGYLMAANGTPVPDAMIYLTCQTGFMVCGSGTAVTSSNGMFTSSMKVQAACGQEVLVQIGYQGSDTYAPYGQNYVAQSPCLTPG
jgi:hypothetical protein